MPGELREHMTRVLFAAPAYGQRRRGFETDTRIARTLTRLTSPRMVLSRP